MGSSESKTYSTAEQFPKLDNIYYPLANGGRPFRVRLENNNAYIDKDKRWDIELDDKDYDKIWNGLPKWELIIETPYIKSFVGKENPNPFSPSCTSDVGSSVLLQINNMTYIYIGIIINELKFKEKVKDFVTETGCRNAVASYILTKNNVIEPTDGHKYPIKVYFKGRFPGDLEKEDIKKYTDKAEIKTLHDFVL
jgi:hypothetical protein